MFDIKIAYDVPVRMRDGVVLKADIYSPESPGPWPVVLIRTPYGKTGYDDLVFADPWTGARRGMVVIVQDVRGRAESEGTEWEPGLAEGQDGYDTVAWAAQLPGSNGNVGMWGQSYLGNAIWRAAAERPPALKAIAPQITWRSLTDGVTHRGEVVELGLTRFWGLFMGIESAIRRMPGSPESESAVAMIISALDDLPGTLDELPTEPDAVVLRHKLPTIGSANGRLGETVSPASIAAPSFNIGGWYDIFLQGTLDNFTEHAQVAPSKLLIGPWTHMSTGSQQGDVNFGVAAAGSNVNMGSSIPVLAYDWLSFWLTETPSAIEDEFPVQIFVMGVNAWRKEPKWPLDRTTNTAMFLGGDGGLTLAPNSNEATLTFVYDPMNPVPTVGGNTLMPHLPAGPFSQADVESRDDVIIFTTARLDNDVEVTGRVVAHLNVSTDAASTDWVVRLCDVDENGRSVNIVDGITRVRHVPGERTEVEVDMWSTSMVFKAGHLIRVQVTSSCFPRWDRNPNPKPGSANGVMQAALQTVYCGGDAASYVTLPIVQSTLAVK